MCLINAEKVALIDDVMCFKLVLIEKDKESGKFVIHSPYNIGYTWELNKLHETVPDESDYPEKQDLLGPTLVDIGPGFFHTYMTQRDAARDANMSWCGDDCDFDDYNFVVAILVCTIPKRTTAYSGYVYSTETEGWASTALIPEKIIYLPKPSQLKNRHKVFSIFKYIKAYFKYWEVKKHFGLNKKNCAFTIDKLKRLYD